MRSVAFDTRTRMTMYEVKKRTRAGIGGIGPVECDDAVVTEEDIAFTIRCPVLVTMTDDDVDSEMGGEIINVMLMDMEFEKLVDLLPSVSINTTAAREHVGEIE